MGKIIVSHPHAAAVANGLSSALARQAALAAYFTGVAVARGTAVGKGCQALAEGRGVLENRLLDSRLRSSLRVLPLVELTARVAGTLAPILSGGRATAYDCLFVSHDAAVSHLHWPRDASAVYAYEDGALRSFLRARQRGLAAVWDLPSPHWRYVEQMHAAEHCRWPGVGTVTPIEPEWKKKRKDGELRLAAAVAVASAFTRASVPDDGSRRPVLVIPYGFPVDLFAPKNTVESERFTVLAVGSQSVRKGTHYLLQAWKHAALKGARLRLIGPMGLSRQFLRDFDGLYEHVPHLPRAKLQGEYQAADLLAFPTLGDGFGLVIQEAMCCGTPVLTTPCGGGPECLNSGEHGWIVSPRDVDALVDILREASRNRDRTKAMGRAARHRAEQWTWDDAARALADGLSGHGLL